MAPLRSFNIKKARAMWPLALEPFKVSRTQTLLKHLVFQSCSKDMDFQDQIFIRSSNAALLLWLMAATICFESSSSHAFPNIRAQPRSSSMTNNVLDPNTTQISSVKNADTSIQPLGNKDTAASTVKSRGSKGRFLIGSTAPICTYNECRTCQSLSRCKAQLVPIDPNDPINSPYHYRCVCH